jgi:hypothetical protein
MALPKFSWDVCGIHRRRRKPGGMGRKVAEGVRTVMQAPVELRPLALTLLRVRDETNSTRIFNQVQNTIEEGVLGLGSADIDNGRLLERAVKNADDAIPRVVIQRVEDFVNDHPARLV